MAGFSDLGSQLKALYDNFTIGQKVSIVIMVLLLTVVFGGLIFWAGRPEYHTLYSKLTPEDAQSIVSNIEGKVKYELRDNGTTILVPKKSIYKLRLDFAAKGLPKGGVVGFEIFDQTQFGVTGFAQRVQFKRALEGELTRTIMNLSTVNSAKVMITMPEDKVFEDEQEASTASVVLGLARSGSLSKNQVQGIVHLVSSSVEGLMPGNITVIDISGNILYKGSKDSEAELASNQYEFKRLYEKNLQKDISNMIDKIVGANKSVVMVSAKFDFDVVNKTEEIVDPEKVAVLSEQRSSETTDSSTGSPGGVPGVRGNVPPTAGGATSERSASNTGKKSSETINYEVSKLVKNTRESVGDLANISVSLLVDGKYKEAPAGSEAKPAEGETPPPPEREYIPRTEEELERISALVKGAIDFDEARGDQVTIENMQFQTTQAPVVMAGMAAESMTKSIWEQVSKYVAPAIMLIVVLLFVIRPMMKWMTQVPTVALPEGQMFASVGPGGQAGVAPLSPEEAALASAKSADDIDNKLAREVMELEAEIAGESKMPEGAKRKQAIKHRIERLADKDPESISQLLKTWIHED